MTAMTVAQRMTAEEFLALRDELPIYPHDLVEGELVVSSPRLPHQEILIRIQVALRNWSDGSPDRGLVLPHIDIPIDDRNVYEPDALWYAQSRRPSREDPGPYPVPDLAVEVRSPSTWRYDVGAKKAGYERKGVRELWLVDIAADTVLVFRRSAPDAPTFDVSLELAAGDVLASPLLEGFELPLDRLFADESSRKPA